MSKRSRAGSPLHILVPVSSSDDEEGDSPARTQPPASARSAASSTPELELITPPETPSAFAKKLGDAAPLQPSDRVAELNRACRTSGASASWCALCTNGDIHATLLAEGWTMLSDSDGANSTIYTKGTEIVKVATPPRKSGQRDMWNAEWKETVLAIEKCYAALKGRCGAHAVALLSVNACLTSNAIHIVLLMQNAGVVFSAAGDGDDEKRLKDALRGKAAIVDAAAQSIAATRVLSTDLLKVDAGGVSVRRSNLAFALPRDDQLVLRFIDVDDAEKFHLACEVDMRDLVRIWKFICAACINDPTVYSTGDPDPTGTIQRLMWEAHLVELCSDGASCTSID